MIALQSGEAVILADKFQQAAAADFVLLDKQRQVAFGLGHHCGALCHTAFQLGDLAFQRDDAPFGALGRLGAAAGDDIGGGVERGKFCARAHAQKPCTAKPQAGGQAIARQVCVGAETGQEPCPCDVAFGDAAFTLAAGFDD